MPAQRCWCSVAYEEEITGEQMDAFFNLDGHSDSFSEAGSFEAEPETSLGPDEYLEHLRQVKGAVGIPVIASLNGVTAGGWISYSKLLENAGADGLELHLYHAASDMTMSAADVERKPSTLREGSAVKWRWRLCATSPPWELASQLDKTGADALVLTRFHRGDIDVEELGSSGRRRRRIPRIIASPSRHGGSPGASRRRSW
jgi:dihydroorotate dehydrogenase (fumarate)